MCASDDLEGEHRLPEQLLPQGSHFFILPFSKKYNIPVDCYDAPYIPVNGFADYMSLENLSHSTCLQDRTTYESILMSFVTGK